LVVLKQKDVCDPVVLIKTIFVSYAFWQSCG